MPVVIFIAFFVIGIAVRGGALMDPDTGWHIAAGDAIRAAGHIPASDPWSYTAGDQPWYEISWAYDVLASVLNSLGGLGAVVVTTVFLYALAVAAIAWIAEKSAKDTLAGFLVAALSGSALLSGMLARPQTLTFLLIIALYAVFRFGGRRLVWTAPVLMAAWANIHGGFLAGYVIVGAFFLEALAMRDFTRARRLFLVGVLCVLAPLANPYGWRVFQVTEMLLASKFRTLIVEWAPISLNALTPPVVLAAVFVLVSALFERSIPLADRLLAAFWIAMGLASARMMHVAAILAAPYLAAAIALRLRATPFGATLEKHGRDYATDLSKKGVRWALFGFAASMMLASFAPPIQRAIGGGGAFAAFPSVNAPSAALDFIEARYPSLRFFNQYGFGGYMAYRHERAPKLFFDGRVEIAYPPKVLSDGAEIGYVGPTNEVPPGDDPRWRALVGKYDVEGFLISPDARLARALAVRPQWTRVFADEDAVVFIRADRVKS
ncbi:MAG TPA: hypothetical protein VNH64_07240 [Parvularculaceae bacterium]|nr:hypothetical protein [Parvularculaceae bacterium]